MFRHAVTIIIRQPILPILADLNVKTKLSWATVLHSHSKITKNQSVTSTINNSSFNFQQQHMVTHIKTIHTKFIPAPYAQAWHHYCHQTAHPADPSRSKNIKKALKNCSTATLLLSRSLHAVLWTTNDSFRFRNHMQIEFSKFWMRIRIQVKVRIHVDPDPGKSSHPCGSGSG